MNASIPAVRISPDGRFETTVTPKSPEICLNDAGSILLTIFRLGVEIVSNPGDIHTFTAQAVAIQNLAMVAGLRIDQALDRLQFSRTGFFEDEVFMQTTKVKRRDGP